MCSGHFPSNTHTLVRPLLFMIFLYICPGSSGRPASKTLSLSLDGPHFSRGCTFDSVPVSSLKSLTTGSRGVLESMVLVLSGSLPFRTLIPVELQQCTTRESRGLSPEIIKVRGVCPDLVTPKYVSLVLQVYNYRLPNPGPLSFRSTKNINFSPL